MNTAEAWQTDRKRAIEWARMVLDDANLVILDTETTGLDERAEIVQLAAINRDGGVIIDTLVRPTRPIPAQATAIHGITDAMVAGAPTFAAIAPKVQVIATLPHRLVIYNMDYDLRLLRQSADAVRYPWPGAIAQCAMLAYSAYVGDWSRMRGGYRWQKLPGGDHSALGDCRATLAILQEMANSNE